MRDNTHVANIGGLVHQGPYLVYQDTKTSLDVRLYVLYTACYLPTVNLLWDEVSVSNDANTARVWTYTMVIVVGWRSHQAGANM